MTVPDTLIEDMGAMTDVEARAYLLPILEKNPESALAWKAMGVLQIRTNDLDWARESFNKYFKYSGEKELKL